MTEQASETAAPAAPAADPKDATIAELQAALTKVQAEAKQHRQGKAAAKEAEATAAQAAMLAQGKFEELAKAREAEVAELRTRLTEVEPQVAAFQADTEARKTALEALIKDLPEDDRNLVNAGSSLSAQEALARRFLGTPTASVVPGSRTSTAETTPAPPDTSNGRALSELKRTDPKAYAAALATKSAPGQGFAARLWGAKPTP